MSSGSAAVCPAAAVGYRAGRTDGPLKCTWTPQATAAGSPVSPHARMRPVRPKIGTTILDFVGETPMVGCACARTSCAAARVFCVRRERARSPLHFLLSENVLGPHFRFFPSLPGAHQLAGARGRARVRAGGQV